MSPRTSKKASKKFSKSFLGIDPGKSGGACLITPSKDLIQFYPWPTSDNFQEVYSQMRRWICECDRNVFCHIEKVFAMKGQGVTSCFTFGNNFGAWKMLLVALGIPYNLKTPQAWQKAVGITKTDGPDPKSRSYNTASRIYPGESFITPRGRIMDEKTDSILIAESARLAQE